MTHLQTTGKHGDANADEDLLGPLLHAVAKTWRAKLDDRLRPRGLSRARWMALFKLARAGGAMPQIELAEALEIGAPAMVALVDRLEREDLVVRENVPGDRRVRLVRLTPQSRRSLAAIEEDAARLRGEILATFSADEVRSLVFLLGKLRSRIESL